MKRVIGLLLGVTVLFPSLTTFDVASAEELSSRYNITIKDNVSIDSVDVDIVGEYRLSPDTIIVKATKEEIKDLSKNDNIKSITQDVLVSPEAIKKIEKKKIRKLKKFSDFAWSIKYHNANLAHNKGFYGQGVKVAILDSGIDMSNPIVSHAVKGGTSVVSWSKNYNDYTGHGTNVAGTLVSLYKGETYGIAPNIELYPVKISASKTDGSAWVSDMVLGVEWAIMNNMDVINISFSPEYGSEELENVIGIAKEKGILVVNSAGNEAQDIDNIDSRCKYSGIICVSSLDEYDNLASFSGYGNEYVKFGVSGVDVISASLSYNGLVYVSGTSISSPIFAGIYALYKSEYKDATLEEILNHMQSSGEHIDTYLPVGKYGKVLYKPMN